MYDKKELYHHAVVLKNCIYVIDDVDMMANVFELDEKQQVFQVMKHVFQVINDYHLLINQLMVDILMVKHIQDEILPLMKLMYESVVIGIDVIFSFIFI